MGSCCLWGCHDLHPQHPDLFGAARTSGLRERSPSAGTFPRAPNNCRPRNSTSALKFTEHSPPRLGGAGNDNKESPASGRGPSGPPQKVQKPQEPGLRGQTRRAAARGPLPFGGRGDSGDRPLRSTPQPLSSPPPFAGLALTLATPSNRGLFPAPPRPRKCWRTLPTTSRRSVGREQRSRHSPGWKAHPECSAAAPDPPPPRGLSGAAWSSRVPGPSGLPFAAGRGGR